VSCRSRLVIYSTNWNGAQWHDMLFVLRHLLFILLPCIIHLVLPAQPRPLSAARLVRNLPGTLEHMLSKMHLLKYVRGAVMRDPTLRERSASWWALERARGEALRTDEDVRNVARRVGLGFDEVREDSVDREGAVLRVSARVAVRGLLRSFSPEQSSVVLNAS
jgi:hypothetical protein